MRQNFLSIFLDRTFLKFIGLALIFSAAGFFFFWNQLVHDQGQWATLQFLPAYEFIALVFVLNLILSFIILKKDRVLAYAFNFLSASISILMLLALILSLRNPNG